MFERDFAVNIVTPSGDWISIPSVAHVGKHMGESSEQLAASTSTGTISDFMGSRSGSTSGSLVSLMLGTLRRLDPTMYDASIARDDRGQRNPLCVGATGSPPLQPQVARSPTPPLDIGRRSSSPVASHSRCASKVGACRSRASGVYKKHAALGKGGYGESWLVEYAPSEYPPLSERMSSLSRSRAARLHRGGVARACRARSGRAVADRAAVAVGRDADAERPRAFL